MIALRPRRVLCLGALALAFGAAAGPAGIAWAGASGSAPCFFLREWTGRWKTQPDAKAIYISVSRRVYRLDLLTAYPLLKSPWAVLRYRDSASTICSPNDFRLVVTDRIGTQQAVVVRKVTRLTPAEVAALPKKLRP